MTTEKENINEKTTQGNAELLSLLAYSTSSFKWYMLTSFLGRKVIFFRVFKKNLKGNWISKNQFQCNGDTERVSLPSFCVTYSTTIDLI